MKVELGAGERAQEDFVRVDLNPKYADIVADALSLPFENGEVEEMRAVDVLEHISYRDTDRALAEWARVMKPGGKLYVQVPDADLIMKWYANGNPNLAKTAEGRCPAILGAAWRLLGGHRDGDYVDDEGDWRWNAHYSLWSRGSLEAALLKAGFDVDSITTNLHPNLLCFATRAVL